MLLAGAVEKQTDERRKIFRANVSFAAVII